MLKKFRRLFSQRTPVEFEVHRRPKPVSAELMMHEHSPPTPSEAKEDAPSQAYTPEALERFHIDLEQQRVTQDRIASSLSHVEEQLEPMGQRLGQQMEAIAGSERHVAELVEAFHSAAQIREDLLQSSVNTMTVATEQQVQVLTVLQQQLDHSQQSMEHLARRLDEVGGGLESLLQAQQTSVERTEDLVEAVRAQVETTAIAHKRLFGVALALIALGGISMIVTVVLVIVYAA